MREHSIAAFQVRVNKPLLLRSLAVKMEMRSSTQMTTDHQYDDAFTEVGHEVVSTA